MKQVKSIAKDDTEKRNNTKLGESIDTMSVPKVLQVRQFDWYIDPMGLQMNTCS